MTVAEYVVARRGVASGSRSRPLLSEHRATRTLTMIHSSWLAVARPWTPTPQTLNTPLAGRRDTRRLAMTPGVEPVSELLPDPGAR